MKPPDAILREIRARGFTLLESDDPSVIAAFDFELMDLRVFVSTADGWEHVCVAKRENCPSWSEMSWIKTLIFEEDEYVFQIHRPRKLEIFKSFALHMWRHPDHLHLPPEKLWDIERNST